MQPRRANSGWWFIGLAGCSTVFICLCVAVVASGAWFVRQPQAQRLLPWSGGAGTLPAVNRIAYTGIDGNIYTMAPDGADVRQVTSDATTSQSPQLVYRFPNWSPDGRSVAFVSISRTGRDEYQSKLYAATMSTSQMETLHTASGTGPFYLYWAPDSRSVAFLEGVGQSIALRLATLGQTESRELGQGSPFYFDWSPDSQRLIWHAGDPTADKTRMGLVRPSVDERSPLQDDPGLFLAPDWSPDGQRLLYARSASSDEELVIADASGANSRSLLTFNGGVSFAWAPSGGKIAYIVTDNETRASLGPIAFGPLNLMDASGENKRELSDDRALAFFWAPDGSKIAYLTIADRNQGAAPADVNQLIAQGGNELRLSWNVIDITTGEKKSLVSFAPTPIFLSLIPYFDQYQRSLRVWSPDSRSLVYTVVEGPSRAGVFVVDVVDGGPRRVADGVEASWSWR